MDSGNRETLIAKAAQAFRLADGCADREIALRLRRYGFEMISQAIDCGAAPEMFPPDWIPPVD